MTPSLNMGLEKEKNKEIAIYSLTSKGAELGKKIKEVFDADLYLPERLAEKFGAYGFKRLSHLIGCVFERYKSHIFITASGIAVRSIAPHLKSKDKDPAVVVLDHKGKYCISLLSGHLGGANLLSKKIASITGGIPVITTATDTEGLPSVEVIAKEKEMEIVNLEALKKVNMAVLEGETIQIFDPEDRLNISGIDFVKIEDEKEWKKDMPGIWVYWKETSISENKLILNPKCLVIGIGCNSGTEASEILDMIKTTFKKYKLSLKSIKAVASVEEKKKEKGLISLADSIKTPLLFFSSEDLRTIKVPHPSECVEKHMGTKSVCEAAAIIGSKMGRLIVPKTKSKNVTIAIAVEYSR